MSQRISTNSITSPGEEQLDLHKACRIGDLQTIKKAFELNKGSINERDDKLGWAPIYRTVICGHIEATKFLLQNGADPNIKNNLGETSLHQVADNSQYKLAQVLLENGADPNLQQNDGDTPLHHAAFRGDAQMAQILLSFNADPNIQNTVFNRTPLHYAVDCNHLEVVRLMLNHDANVFIKDRQGKSAISFAVNNEIQLLLKEAEEKQESRVLEPKQINKKTQNHQTGQVTLNIQQQKEAQNVILQENLIQQIQQLDDSTGLSLQDISGTGQYSSN